MKKLIVTLAICFFTGSGCGGALLPVHGVMALVDLIQYVATEVVPAFTGDKAYCDANQKTLEIDRYIACTELQDAYRYVQYKVSIARVAEESGDEQAKERARAELQRVVNEFEQLRRDEPVRGEP